MDTTIFNPHPDLFDLDHSLLRRRIQVLFPSPVDDPLAIDA